MHKLVNSPVAGDTVAHSVDPVASDAAGSHHLCCHILVDGLKCCQCIALDLRKMCIDRVRNYSTCDSITNAPDQIYYDTYLDGAPILALSPDSCQIALKHLDLDALLQQGDSKHETSNASSSDEDLHWPCCTLNSGAF